MKSSVGWLILAKRFPVSFFAGVLFAILFWTFWFVVDSCGGRIAVIAYKYDDILTDIAFVAMWCGCAWMSLKSTHVLHVFAVPIGLTWGTVFSMAVDNFNHNRDEMSDWLPIMVHGALVIPVVTSLTVLPFWYFGKRRHDWDVRRMNYCLKIALVTPLFLIGVYSATFSCYWFLSRSEVRVWQGTTTREVHFRTRIYGFWRPAFNVVERVWKYENYETGCDDHVFSKSLDKPKP
jgi:hypothetical protein